MRRFKPEPARRVAGKKRARGGRARDEPVEVVRLEGIESPAGGRVAVSFESCSFLVSDLQVRGKLPRAWLEREIEALRAAGRLATRAEDVADTKAK